MKGLGNIILLLFVLALSAHKANAAKATYPPESKETYKYDLQSAGINLSIFKLFTIQPNSKGSQNRDKIKSPKTDSSKIATPIKSERVVVPVK